MRRLFAGYVRKALLLGVVGVGLLMLSLVTHAALSGPPREVYSGTVTVVYDVPCGHRGTRQCTREMVTFEADGSPRVARLLGVAPDDAHVGRPVTVEWVPGSFYATEPADRSAMAGFASLTLALAIMVLFGSLTCAVAAVRERMRDRRQVLVQ